MRRVAGGPARRQDAHRRLGEEIAGEILRVAEAGPLFDAEIAIAGPAPDAEMRKILAFDRNRRAIRRLEADTAARRIEKAECVIVEQGCGERQNRALERQVPRLPRDQPAGGDPRHFRIFGLGEAKPVIVRAAAGKGPAEAGMEAAGIGHRPLPRIGHRNLAGKRPVADAVGDRETKITWIEGAGLVVT